MSHPLSRTAAAAVAVLTLAGCASGGGGGGDPEAPAPELSGVYRIEARLTSPRSSEEIAGTITIQDDSFLNFVSDFNRTNVPAPCRYYVRGSRIETECEGYDFTFRMEDDGRIRVDILQDLGRRGQSRGIGYLVRG